MRKKLILAYGGFLLLALWCGLGLSAEAAVIVPFGACGWRFLQPPASYNENEISRTSYDDSAWPTACGPLVASWSCGAPGTTLPADGTVLMRRHIWNQSGSTVLAFYEVRTTGAYSVHWNGGGGNGGGSNEQRDCPPKTDHAALQLSPGENAVLFSSASYRAGAFPSIGGYLDVQISVDDPTAVNGKSWGQLKLIYR